MKIAILLSLAILNLVYGLPVGMDQQLLPQEQGVQEAVGNTDAMASLTELSDLGSQHYGEGARRARFLWAGIWAGPYWPRYYYSYYRPWGYRYWW
ncbi:hypothetical protein KR215_007985 [Drosophila sulfurigaster]|nr:hypothetical protein KR215_007985 [Drosophila sulfurigaster]